MKKNKILQIWAITISALWLISISNNKINPLSQNDDFRVLNTSFADDDYEEEEEEEEDDEDDKAYFLDNILSDSSINNTWNQDNISKLFKAPNWKIYSIIDDWTTVSIKKWDWTSAKKTFSNYDEAISYLKKNAIPSPEVYKAPNGKNYTIMFENWKIVVKKPDWSYAAKTFTSYTDAKIYLDKNAPKPLIIAKPIIKKTIAKKTITLNKKVTKKVIAKPVIAVPKPVVKVPKVDTITKAS